MRNANDPTLGLEHEIIRAQINKESLVSVFFYIETADDMTWVDGLLIKLCQIVYKWENA